jgi:3-phenylpropionate/cinnamic acid dioxygenase small subunit
MNAQVQTSTRGNELRLEFEQLLYREAWLLDHGHLDDWLELLAEEVRYWAPVRLDRVRGEDDFSRRKQMAHLDEDRQGLIYRVRRIQTGITATDEPPARVRHFISNVYLLGVHEEICDVCSNFMIFHSHVGTRDHTLVGSREDKWQHKGGGWKLRERLIVLDQTVVPGLSVLF